VRRACTRSIGGCTASCAAMRTGRSFAHSWVRALTPERPVTMASQVDAASPPSGVDAPIPVTTTSTVTATPRYAQRSCDEYGGPWFARSRLCLGDVRGRIAHGPEVLHLVVRDLHAELLLGRHDNFHHGQRVDVEVLGERLVLGDVVRVHAGDLLEDLGETGYELITGGHRCCFLPCGGGGYGQRTTCPAYVRPPPKPN